MFSQLELETTCVNELPHNNLRSQLSETAFRFTYMYEQPACRYWVSKVSTGYHLQAS